MKSYPSYLVHASEALLENEASSTSSLIGVEHFRAIAVLSEIAKANSTIAFNCLTGSDLNWYDQFSFLNLEPTEIAEHSRIRSEFSSDGDHLHPMIGSRYILNDLLNHNHEVVQKTSGLHSRSAANVIGHLAHILSNAEILSLGPHGE
ncbi:hypothetical protein KC946_00655 [Candidatus Saccharibacteria bacterium]|nr:hypothetical protein [Candidatus Saccharibacteria bacterium]